MSYTREKWDRWADNTQVRYSSYSQAGDRRKRQDAMKQGVDIVNTNPFYLWQSNTDSVYITWRSILFLLFKILKVKNKTFCLCFSLLLENLWFVSWRGLRLGISTLGGCGHDVRWYVRSYGERIFPKDHILYYFGDICMSSNWNSGSSPGETQNKHKEGRDTSNKDAVIVHYVNTMMNFLTTRKIITSCHCFHTVHKCFCKVSCLVAQNKHWWSM